MTHRPLRAAARLATAAAVAFASLGTTAPADAGTLTINIAFKGASQRAVWQSTIEAFHKAHPDIDVKPTFVDEEAYKVQLPAWLTTVAPDVVNWHAGERMAYYAKRGLFEDLSGDWTKNGWDAMYASTRGASSYNGKQYAAPTVYYSWGLFYRKDLFRKVGIADEPKTWDQFLDACKKLKAAGITPIAIG
ncbi:sugar ABC transporter substrate-binding protein, partial [Burkholderia cenocepacia]|uniref:ABC transporter substrate-binding protein n=2 Tax=Burkholderiaceae TaxID=119060 RepID=UPI0009C60055